MADPTTSRAIPRTVADAVQPGRVGLVVYDMQVGILSQLKDGPAVLEKVKQVLEAARRAGVPTFFLRHLSLPRNLMGTFQMRQAMAWQRTDSPGDVHPWFLRGSPGFEIADEIRPLETEAVFDKLGMSAFEGTPLAMAFRDLGLDTVLLVGVATEIGLEPTVRHASDLGLLTVLIEDACGAGHAEAGERALASLRFMGDAMFSTLDEATLLLSRFKPDR